MCGKFLKFAVQFLHKRLSWLLCFKYVTSVLNIFTFVDFLVQKINKKIQEKHLY